MQFLRGLKKFAQMFPSGVGWASVCTGTGIEVHALEALSSFYMHTHAIDFRFHHAYMCDNSLHVQKHLTSQFGGDGRPILFDDLSTVSEFRRGVDVFTGTTVSLPHNCVGFLGGFSCTSRSAKNSNAAANVNCVQTVSDLSLQHNQLSFPAHGSRAHLVAL